MRRDRSLHGSRRDEGEDARDDPGGWRAMTPGGGKQTRYTAFGPDVRGWASRGKTWRARCFMRRAQISKTESAGIEPPAYPIYS